MSEYAHDDLRRVGRATRGLFDEVLAHASDLYLPHHDNHDVLECPTERAVLDFRRGNDSECFPPYALAVNACYWGGHYYNLWLPRCRWTGTRNDRLAIKILFEDVFDDRLIINDDLTGYIYDVWGRRTCDPLREERGAMTDAATVYIAGLPNWNFLSTRLIKLMMPPIPVCAWCHASREEWGWRREHVIALWPKATTVRLTRNNPAYWSTAVACSKVCARKVAARGYLARARYMKGLREWTTARSKLKEARRLLRQRNRSLSRCVESAPSTMLRG